MTESWDLRHNTATAAEIAEHLAQNDDAFLPRLSERVRISDYALKIVGSAERFEAWASGALIGLVAAYCNDTEALTAHVTSVSVSHEYRNRGLASRLLVECVEFVKRRQFTGISLDVDQENQRAVELYEAKGFSVVSMSGRTIRMHLDTREDMDMGGQS